MNIEQIHWDVVVVGGGVAGALLAWRLALEGKKVLILEAGPELADRIELVGNFARATQKIPSSPYRFSAHAPIPRETDKPNGSHYMQAGVDPFKSMYLRQGGGSTWHWLGNVPRLLPNDFKMRSVYGIASDWPLSYEELEPYYDLAERELGVSGERDEWEGVHGAWRSNPFPMPAIWAVYGDGVVRTRLSGFSFDDVTPRLRITPQARNSVTYQDRPPCAGNSSCVPICPIAAKYDATVHLKRALSASREGGLDAQILYKAVVKRLVRDSSGIVHRVEFDHWDGETRMRREVTGSRFVVAAHAIESPLILFESGLGQDTPVGRHLMDHPQGYVGAIMPEPVYPFRGPPVTSGIDEFRDGEFRRNRAAFRVSIGNDAWGRMQPLESTLREYLEGKGLYGVALRTALNDRVTRMIRFSFSTEMPPDPDNRVLVGGYDEKGNPKPRLEFKIPEYTLRTFDYARRLCEEMFVHMKATESLAPSGFSGAGHIMGTCRMGTDRAHSVVDREGRLHDHPEVRVIGASTFPTGGTANPTLTVAALALRAADSMLQE